MDHHEEAVMHCLTANGETFVASEPELGDRWSRPDFIAIRPPKKQAYVVEVSDSGYPRGLVAKVNVRENQWLKLLRQHLENRGIADATWSYRVLVFVRRDQRDYVQARIKDKSDIAVLCLEEASADWEWSDMVSTPDFSFEADPIARGAHD
jgi:hypothetical protein